MSAPCPKVFLLSPANAGGRRAEMLMNPKASFELAVRLREGSATLGEVYTFISGLYFRGKITYASRFSDASATVPAVQIITPGAGFLAPGHPVTVNDFRKMSEILIDLNDSRYLDPLEQSAHELRMRVGEQFEVVLLGSIATAKYVEPLLGYFGERLLFPADFVGRGDMSRGGLMLRSAAAGAELNYISLIGAVRRGRRPAKLPQL